MVTSMMKPYRCSKEQALGHFENEEKTEEPCKYVHIDNTSLYVALCSFAYTSSLNTMMSDDGCPSGQVKWSDI